MRSVHLTAPIYRKNNIQGFPKSSSLGKVNFQGRKFRFPPEEILILHRGAEKFFGHIVLFLKKVHSWGGVTEMV
ncbi:hypothetical protein, partial [uncultured Porphyromonas sp.]|uniref:hypothetical protein n=1 Tax=uncultured Porphyromonas sp. TaxID=159274 RepID=UPI002633F4EE